LPENYIFIIYINDLLIIIAIYTTKSALDSGVLTNIALGSVGFRLGSVQPARDTSAQWTYHHQQGGEIGNHSRNDEQQA
jgi:hypothetical protein